MNKFTALALVALALSGCTTVRDFERISSIDRIVVYESGKTGPQKVISEERKINQLLDKLNEFEWTEYLHTLPATQYVLYLYRGTEKRRTILLDRNFISDRSHYRRLTSEEFGHIYSNYIFDWDRANQAR